MASKKKDSPLKNMIREAAQELHSGEFPDDPGMDKNEISGPERFAKTQKQKDEVIIDRLLAPIAGKTGYFLKLKKEVRPNEWMLMKVIKTEWRNWPDMESAVSDIVKEHTVHAPAKWGSGQYKIEYACDGGIRGDNYRDCDFHINAEEEFIKNPAGAGTIIPQQVAIDPATAVAGQIDTLANLVGMLKNFLPQAADPSKTQESIASAFKEGMALKVSEGSNNNQMMGAMMTGLFGMMTAMMTNKRDDGPRVVNSEMDQMKGMLETLKTFGVLGNQNQEKQKTTIDFITELKALGMDLFKKEDPIAQMSQLKQLASIAGEFMGMGGTGEKPGILEKIVDMVGPAIPGMIKDIKDTASNAVEVQRMAGQNIERARISVNPDIRTVKQEGSNPQMNMGTNTAQAQQTGQNPQVTAFFNGLYDAVNQNNRMFYPIVYTSLLQEAQGQAMVQGIVNGTQTAKELIELLQQYGGDKYKDSEFVMKRLVSYTNGFIIWIREMMKAQQPIHVEPTQEQRNTVAQTGISYDVECPICNTVFSYDNEQEFRKEESKECGQEHNGVICPGTVRPISKAS